MTAEISRSQRSKLLKQMAPLTEDFRQLGLRIPWEQPERRVALQKPEVSKLQKTFTKLLKKVVSWSQTATEFYTLDYNTDGSARLSPEDDVAGALLILIRKKQITWSCEEIHHKS